MQLLGSIVDQVVTFEIKLKKKNLKQRLLSDTYVGRGGEIRTLDPLVPNQMRYQAALRPEYLDLYFRNL